MGKKKVAIIGVTGSVGQEFVQSLDNHPWFEVTQIAASERSAGKNYLDAIKDASGIIAWDVGGEIPEYIKNMKVLKVEDRAGFGAAGGVSCGLAVLLGATIVSGVATIAELIGLQEKIKHSDCVITGEGSFDDQSYRGKAVGYLLEKAKECERPVMIACGVNKNEESPSILSLIELAPSVQSAIADSQRWLIECGRELATRFNY